MDYSTHDKQTSIALYTFGCRLNQSETAVIENTLLAHNYHIVDIQDKADIVVINTCTVTANGDADTRRLVNKVNRLNPESKIALIGCQAQIQKDQLLELPNVQWVIGNAEKMNLAQILNNHKPDDYPQVIAPTISRDSFTMPTAGINRKHTRANIKIQDGCDFFCSFCEIPYARGRARSRTFADIINETDILVREGYKEIVITGINVGTYRDEGYNITDVIKAMEQIHGLERIRISSIEPTTIPESMIDKMADPSSKLCRYLHIPLQSGSDKILQSMKRHYTVAEFSDFIQYAHDRVPEICIGTDIIVGFPGETEQNFEESADLFRSLPLHYAHVFSYSQRQLAKSREFDKTLTVPTETIQERSRVLRELSNRKRLVYYKSLINTKQNVLFEQQKEGYWVGLTDNFAKVKMLSNQDLANTILNIVLIDVNEFTLVGSDPNESFYRRSQFNPLFRSHFKHLKKL